MDRYATVVTDSSWRASTGPVYLDSIRAGEFYDARRELPGWSTPEFDDSAWDEPTSARPARRRPVGTDDAADSSHKTH